MRPDRSTAVGTHAGDGDLSEPQNDTPRPGPAGAPAPGEKTPPGSSASAGTPPAPGGAPASGASTGDAPTPDRGVRWELGAAWQSGRRMFRAHLDLAKAEIGLITDRAKVALAFVGMALALVVFAALVATVGTPLFIGEWLFGSIGWGVLHAVLFGVAVAVACVMLALELTPRHVALTLAGAAVIGSLVGGIFLLNLPHAAWAWVGDQVDVGTTIDIDPGYRPLVVAAFFGALVGAIVGMLAFAWQSRSFSGAIGGLFVGAIALAAFCAFTAITFSVQCAVGIGIAVTLAVWPVLVSRPVWNGTYDWDGLASKYWPGLTIEVAQDTLEEVRLRLPDMPSMPKWRSGR